MSTVQRIAKNSAWQLLSNIFQKIFSLIIIFILAKKFGVDNFGLYSFAFSFVAIFSVIADFGINNLLVREISKDPSKAQAFLSNALVAKLILSIISFLGIFISAILLNLDPFKFSLVILAGMSLFLDNLSGLFRGLFYSFEIFKYETLISFFYKLCLLLLSLFVFIFGYGLIELLIVAAVSSIFNLIISIYFSLKKTIFPKFDKISRNGILLILRSATPFLFIGLIMSLYANIDILLLQWFWTQTEVGIYSAAVRLVSALSVFSVMFMNSVHPVATRFFAQNNKSISTVVTKSLYYITIFIFPVAIGTAILSKDLVLFFYDIDFLGTALPLTILAFTQIFSFANHVYVTMLYSIQREKQAFIQVFISTLINIVLNLLIFIPIYATIGASIATFLAELVSFAVGYYFLSKYVIKLNLMEIYARPAIASVFMGLLLLLIYPLIISFSQSSFSSFQLLSLNSSLVIQLFLALIFSIPVYILALILVKAFSKEDVSFFKKLFELVKS